MLLEYEIQKPKTSKEKGIKNILFKNGYTRQPHVHSKQRLILIRWERLLGLQKALKLSSDINLMQLKE